MSKAWFLDVLVISGGGMKGIGFLGSLLPLEEKYGKDIWKKVTYIAGSSIGGFFAVGLVIGYSIQEMIDLFLVTNFPSFCSFFQNDQKKVIALKQLLVDLGMDQGQALFSYITSLLEKKIPPHITFQELYEKTQQTVLLTSACLTDGETYYFSWYHTPHMEVRKAILMTIRLPILFTPILHEEKLHIDGNFFDPFPLRALPKEARKKAREGNLLGIVPGKLEQSYKIESSFQLVNVLLSHIAINYVDLSCKRYKNSILRLSINTNGINFTLTREDLEKAVEWGKEQGKKYFASRSYPTLR